MFAMIWERTKEIMTDRWSSHWTRYHIAKCQNGDKQRDFWLIRKNVVLGQKTYETVDWRELATTISRWITSAEIWCADLVEMQQFSKWNRGYWYLLMHMVLDVFSKCARGWIEPLKDKKGETVAAAFEKPFKEGRERQFLWVDKGKEFYNKNLKELLAKYGIKMYSTENEEKSSVCERWNRTIKTKMRKQFTVQGNTKYLDILPEILKQYSNTKHSSTKMTLTEAS